MAINNVVAGTEYVLARDVNKPTLTVFGHLSENNLEVTLTSCVHDMLLRWLGIYTATKSAHIEPERRTASR